MAPTAQKKIICIAALIAAVTFFIGYTVFYQIEAREAQGYGKNDFTVFYAAGSSLTKQLEITPREIYSHKIIQPLITKIRQHKGGTRYLYPPQALLIFAPFTFFNFDFAAKAWLLINGLFFLTAFYLSIYLIDKKIYRIRYTILLIALAFTNTVYNLMESGQINALLWLLLMLTIFFASKQKQKTDYVAGVLLGFATIIKIFPLLFWPYFLLKKQWRIVLGALATVMLAVVVFLPIIPWSVNIDYAKKIFLPKIVQGEISEQITDNSLYGTLADYLNANRSPLNKIIKKNKDIIYYFSAILMLIIISMILYFNKNQKNNVHYLIDYGILMLFILLFYKGVHVSYNLFTIPLLMFFFAKNINPKTVLWLICGIFLLLLTQWWGVFGIFKNYSLYCFSTKNIGLILLLLFLLIIHFKPCKKMLISC